LPEKVSELLRDFSTGGVDCGSNGGERQGIGIVMDAELCRRFVHCRQNVDFIDSDSRGQAGDEALDAGIGCILHIGQKNG
jgi:hypothetical protein